MKACLLLEHAQNIDEIKTAKESIMEAINTTLPGWNFWNCEEYLYSSFELENILLYIKILYMLDASSEEGTQLLEKIYGIIKERYGGEKFLSRILPKCVYLMSCCEKTDEWIMLNRCEEAIDLLGKESVIYLMLPLIRNLIKICESLELKKKIAYWSVYRDALQELNQKYDNLLERDSLIFHWAQNECHLENEVIRGERIIRNISQEKLADEIFSNTSSISNFETGKSSPNKNNFERMMQRLGMEKSRWSGIAVTESFDMLEDIWNMRKMLGHREYDKLENFFNNMGERKNEIKRDDAEVLRIIQLIVWKMEGSIEEKEFLKEIQSKLYAVYPMDRESYERKPFLREMDLVIMYLCEMYKQDKKYVINCWEKLYSAFKNSAVDTKYCYRTYEGMMENYLIHKSRTEYNEEVERMIEENMIYSLKLGKGGPLSSLFWAMATTEKNEKEITTGYFKNAYLFAELYQNKSANVKKYYYDKWVMESGN
jgi:transcriptional regulator with XRE-family HTH domain